MVIYLIVEIYYAILPVREKIEIIIIDSKHRNTVNILVGNVKYEIVAHNFTFDSSLIHSI